MSRDITITGLQEAQRGNLLLIASLQPGGALEDAVRIGTTAAHRYAVAQTHVDTGALRASHRVKVEGTKGTVFIDRSARNPRSRRLTSQYAAVEHFRGGEHAFYEITVDRYGDQIASQVAAAYISRMPK